MKQIDETAFTEDAKGGMPFRELLKKYGTSPARTMKLMNSALGDEDVEPVEEDAEPEAFDITININTDRIMPILRSVEPQELLEAVEGLDAATRAVILQAVMQRKFDKLLEPANMVEMPTLSLRQGRDGGDTHKAEE